jgi:hypothetical protein
MVATLAVSLSASAVIAATAASAAVPSAPDNLMVFPNRDFISVEGYQNHVGDTATVSVTRSGVLVGSAQAVVAAGDVAFEINHPGGACWGAGTDLQVTPDILPGDVATISFGGHDVGDTRVQDAYADADATLGTTTVDGTMVTVTGHIGADVIQDNTEQRIVDPALVDAAGKRDVRAVPGPMTLAPSGRYSSSLTFNDTDHTFLATYLFDDPATAAIAANASLGERLLSWELVDAAGNRQGVTIAEFGEVGGPGVGGCPAGASDAVTSTSPAVLNEATMAAGGDLTVSGVSYNSSEVSLAVAGPNGATIGTATANATPTPLATTATTTLPGNQTWQATIPIAALAAVPDGRLQLAITTKRVTVDPAGAASETSIAGASMALLKDTNAPDKPTLSPGAGTYIGTQHVTVTGATDTSVLRYQSGSAAVANPTLSVGNTVTGQIVVSSSQTLKVVGFDAAGNASPALVAAYTIDVPATVPPAAPVVPPAASPVPPATSPVPAPAPVVVAPAPAPAPAPPSTTTRTTTSSAPRIGAAIGGKAGGKVTATVTWKAPLNNGGSSISRYKVSIRRVGHSTVVTRTVSAGTRSLTVKGLVAHARYRFYVSAVNARGTSPRSALSTTVVAA